MPIPTTTATSEADSGRLLKLIEQVARQDADALHALYDLTAAKLFGLALRILIKREWAEEVLQESYINIWRFAKDYRPGLSAPMTWMSTIVRHRALDYLRRVGDHETEWNDTLDNLLPSFEPDPAERALLSQGATRLGHCLDTLEVAQRQAIALAYLRELPHQDVAQIMQTPLGTVKSWIRRGLAKLKTCLEG